MNRKKVDRNILPLIPIMIILLFTISCAEDPYYGEIAPNKRPLITLNSGPPEGDETVHKVEFRWMGEDPDGKVEFYEFAMVSGDPLGFDPADTTGQDKWRKTYRTDSIFSVSAENYDTNLTIARKLYSRYHQTHTFFIRAVDNRGMKSEPAYRSFTAWTLAPYVYITIPPRKAGGGRDVVPTKVTFRWEAYDPIGAPQELQPVDSIRYLWDTYTFSIIDDLNNKPEMFEKRWRPWISYTNEADSGVTTTIGDDELTEENHTYILAVQAKDEAGAVTSIFNNTNVRIFKTITPNGPIITIKEPFLGEFVFVGTLLPPKTLRVPAGYGMNFSWEGDASHYGSSIASYRYGWDISSIDDPSQWETTPSLDVIKAPEKKLYLGTHTLFVEAVDAIGICSLAQIEITIFQLDMPRNLLWVDDFYSTDFYQRIYAIPTEPEHDEFWINICSRAQGFSPSFDIYDTKDTDFTPPSAELVWQYKNVIWTYTSNATVSAWHKIIRFTPEGGYYEGKIFNYLPLYIKSGGHIWTLGKSDRMGGLSANLYNNWPQFPLNVRCEMLYTTYGCADTTGARSFSYKHYCVTSIDKVFASAFKVHTNLSPRTIDRDALDYAFKDLENPITQSMPGLPDTLTLWEEVTKPGRYFDPEDKGFTYVEVYNPEYWMMINDLSPQPCFNPIYRIKTRKSYSDISNGVIAFCSTKHAHVKAYAKGAVAAPCFQFGFPLWHFNRDQVNAIADAIFDRWNILDPDIKNAQENPSQSHTPIPNE
jgi:hypothetical protein